MKKLAPYLFLVAVLSSTITRLHAQCSGCTQTVTTNSNINVNSGQVVCLTFAGTYTQTITLNGGTLCVSSATTVSNSANLNTSSGSTVNNYGTFNKALNNFNGGYTFNNYGTFNAGISLGGGIVNNYGTLTASSLTANSGAITNSATSTMTLPNTTFNSGFSLTSTGTITIPGFTLNTGSTVSLTGTTQTINGAVTNNGTFALANSNINGAFTNNGGSTTNLSGNPTITGNVTNNGTINLAGSLTINGTYSDNSSAVINETSSGCNQVVIKTGTPAGNGTFNGNSNGLIINTPPSRAASLTAGASAPSSTGSFGAPTSFSASLTSATINGSYTGSGATVSYIVLRYTGVAAVTDTPVNYTSYTVGNIIGSSTVVSVGNIGTGAKAFADNIPANRCGMNAYYRIFSYITSAQGCITYKNSPLTGSVTIPAVSAASIGTSPSTTVCAGATTTLTASAGASYLWSTGSTTNRLIVNPLSTTNYRVTVTNSTGCTASASQTITVNALPTITPYLNVNYGGWYSVTSGTLCQGGNVEFGPQPIGGTWSWTGPLGYTNTNRDYFIYNMTPAMGGTYVATYTDGNGCQATQNFNITVNASPNPAVANANACGGSATLTATATSPQSYAWNTGETTPSITKNYSSTFTVTVTGTNTCTATASGSITINSVPTPSVNSPSVCAGRATTLTASGGTSYSWSTGAAVNAINVNPASTTTYTVTVSNAGGCTASANSTVTVNTIPTANFTNNTPICLYGTLNLTAAPSGGSGTYTYSWSGPNGFSSTTQNPSKTNMQVADSGIFNLTVTDGNNCSASIAKNVGVNINCPDSTTIGVNGGGSSDAPCTQILRFDHYNDALASAPGGQNHTWILKNGYTLSMNTVRQGNPMTTVAAPVWGGAAMGNTGYTGLVGRTVLYTTQSGWAKVIFSNIQCKDSLGLPVSDYTLIGIDGESTDGAERDTLLSNGTSWYDYDTILPPAPVGSVPSETGIGTNQVVWAGTGPVNAQSRLVSTNTPTQFSFSTVAGGLQGFAIGVSNTINAPDTAVCSGTIADLTARNLNFGTTYTWGLPTISPAGALTGATTGTNQSKVLQTLTNTTTSVATATYIVTPSTTCSGITYRITLTVKPGMNTNFYASSPGCIGSAMSLKVNPVGSTAPYSYQWSGPAAFSATTQTIVVTSVQVGTYKSIITDSNGCKFIDTLPVNPSPCLQLSGSLFNDANGDGIINGTDATTNLGQTIYAVLCDTNGLVLSSVAAAANGSFTLANMTANKKGLFVTATTASLAIGSTYTASSWPSTWSPTKGNLGLSNNIGTGVTSSTIIRVTSGTENVTNVLIGFDRLPTTSPITSTIPYPLHNAVKAVTPAYGMTNLSSSDPEEGTIANSFTINDVSAMNGNTLFYDANGDGVPQAGEIISSYTTINSFNASRLKVKFTGLGSTQARFTYGGIDAASRFDANPSTYTIRWTGALPVKFLSFDAYQLDEHTAKINWATGAEIDNDRFELERASDATDWAVIDEVKGAGNSVQTLYYQAMDRKPLNGVNYYRLKQIDYDGNYAYSSIVQVTFSRRADLSTSLAVYPNPVGLSQTLHLVLSGSDDVINTITITNSIGQVVRTLTGLDAATIELSISDLAMGVYTLQLHTRNSNQHTARLMIQ